MPPRRSRNCARQHHGKIVIDAVVPDYYARLPKPCVGGWGRRSLNVTPAGKVLPCHAAESIPGLEFWSVREHSLADIWANSPAFNAFRGTDWMQEPCASCARREIDFGGCRCQAFALTGDARATDPVCHLSPAQSRRVSGRSRRSDPTRPTTTAACRRGFPAQHPNCGSAAPDPVAHWRHAYERTSHGSIRGPRRKRLVFQSWEDRNDQPTCSRTARRCSRAPLGC